MLIANNQNPKGEKWKSTDKVQKIAKEQVSYGDSTSVSSDLQDSALNKNAKYPS